MISQRGWYTLFLALFLGLSGAGERSTSAQDIDFNEAERMLDLNMVELADQLNMGLRLTTTDQKQFVQSVLTAVRQKRIPRSMVNVVFVWSKNKNAKYPFIYFQIAMRTLASRRGVEL